MKTFTALVSVALAVSGVLAQDALTINTPPSAVVCQPLLLQWSGGTPPYFLSILPGNQPGAPPLVDFGRVEGTSRSWLVNIAANTQIGLTLRDSTGVVAQSAPFTIQSGTDTSCLGGSSTTSSSSTSGSTSSSSTSGTVSITTTSSTSTTTSVATTTATTTSSTSTTRSTTSSTTSTAPASTSSGAGNGAAGKLSQISVAGALGAVAAIILA